MGRIIGKFISGAVGPVIFKKLGNTQVVVGRTSKHQIAMTKATYDAAYIFGMASTFASYLRNSAAHVLRFYDSGMISRLTGECNSILQKTFVNMDDTLAYDYFARLNGFEFNQASSKKTPLCPT